MQPDATDRTIEHIRLLSVFYYVAAGLTAICGSFPIIHGALGIWMMTEPDAFGTGANAPPAFMGPLFAAIGVGTVLMMWVMAALMVYAGLCLRDHRHRTFVLVMAGVACLNFPFGTALGVFTFVVLLRPEAEALFRAGPPQQTGVPSLPDSPPRP